MEKDIKKSLEKIDQILEPQRRWQEQIDRLLEPQRRLQEQMDRYLEPQRRLQEQMDRYLEPQRLLHKQIEKYLNPLSDYLSSPLMAQIAVNDSGMITISNEIVDLKTIIESVSGIDQEYSSTDEFLEHLFRLLEKLNGVARTVIIYLILPYILAIIANLTTPIYEEWWKEYAELDQRSAKKEIIRVANEVFSPQDLSDFRFVYATILNVRESGNANSEIIGELYLGKTVRLIRKSKSWSFIEYEDSDTGTINQGWVFSRYLRRFSE